MILLEARSLSGPCFMSPEKGMIDQLRNELPVLNLLRQIFLSEPNRDLLEEIGRITLGSEEREGLEGLRLMRDSVKRNEKRMEDWSRQLALEFARLFLGPAHPPAIPYASFYLSETHSLMTEETLEVRKRYLEAGLSLKNLHCVPDDHIGIEIEFVYYLTQEIIGFFEKGQGDEAWRLLELRNAFLKKHMSLWVPHFVGNVMEFTNEDFYQGAAVILQEMIEVYQ